MREEYRIYIHEEHMLLNETMTEVKRGKETSKAK